MDTVKNTKTGEVGEVVGKTSGGVTVKVDGQTTWWSDTDVGEEGASFSLETLLPVGTTVTGTKDIPDKVLRGIDVLGRRITMSWLKNEPGVLWLGKDGEGQVLESDMFRGVPGNVSPALNFIEGHYQAYARGSDKLDPDILKRVETWELWSSAPPYNITLIRRIDAQEFRSKYRVSF